MKLSALSEKQLAAVVAAAGIAGTLVSLLVSTFFVDARTDRQTDVQLVQLAVGILSEPLPAAEPGVDTPETVLRAWAVDTINAAAEVKLDTRARDLLVSGQAQFPEARVDVPGQLTRTELFMNGALARALAVGVAGHLAAAGAAGAADVIEEPPTPQPPADPPAR